MFDLFGDLVSTTMPRPDGTQLAMLNAPAESSKGLVLAVHGFTGAKEDYLFLLPELAAKGWTAIALDLRGVFKPPREGRRNRYRLRTDLPLRHPVEAHRTVAALLGMLLERAELRRLAE